MKILLINPKFPPSYWGQEYNGEITGYSYVFPPLGLATIAALSKGHDVVILDENVEKLNYEYAKEFDIVGLTGYMIQSKREFEICDELRKNGSFVVIGGPNAYLIGDECKKHCDVVIKGEAELLWPEFLIDFANNNWKDHYEDTEKVDMAMSPVPRFDLLKLDKYIAGVIQTTRGCPFSCDFCDIIVMYGRKVREKPVAQIIEEVDLLNKMGKKNIFFADDNFIGNKRYAKSILRALIEYNKTQGNILEFYTQVSINLARDEELLQLMYEARFLKVFIGVETPRKASLAGVGKGQNVNNDLMADIRKIQSYNILIMAGMIVGFDNDDYLIFQEQVDFLQEAGIPYAMVGTLQAVPHTPLYARLEKENRLIHMTSGNNFVETNIIPKSMTLQQLMEGYAWLTEHLYGIEQFTKRILKNISSFKLEGVPFSVKFKWREFMIFVRTVKFSFHKWKYLKSLVKISWAVLRKSPQHFGQIIAMYLGYIHMSRYIKHHMPSKEDIAKIVEKVSVVRARLPKIELPVLHIPADKIKNI
ncbi:MAG: B12-binding domain-containing radical SAM protein [Spirochaetota bacterium]|nr:B12-binding domain-containing radical SAM protein [Spirochaetota bacterium]